MDASPRDVATALVPARLGTLDWRVARSADPDRLDPAVAPPVAAALALIAPGLVGVADIDPEVADTAQFCARYDVPMAASANCVVVAGRRGDEVRYAACVVLATTRADVNGLVRRRLDARKASFAPMLDAVASTGMEFGGITPIGVPSAWLLLIDRAVVTGGPVVIGSGLRRSKLLLDGRTLLTLPNAEPVDGLAS